MRFRAEVDEYNARLAIFKGELDIYGVRNSVQVTKNETITLDLNDPEHYALANLIQPGPYDAWNNDRERFGTQYAAAGANGAYGSAYGELDNYGRYTYVPGYGNMWRPWNVGMNWSPLGHGAWRTTPGTATAGFPPTRGAGCRTTRVSGVGFRASVGAVISTCGRRRRSGSTRLVYRSTAGRRYGHGNAGAAGEPAHRAGVGGPLPPGSKPHPPIVVDGDPIGVKKGPHGDPVAPGDGGGVAAGAPRSIR